MIQINLSAEAKLIVAKSDAEDRGKWLPLHFHLQDTAQVMSRLFNVWLCPAARQAMAEEIDLDTFCRVAVFLALVHDLGKATPAFQQKIVGCIDGMRERMDQYDLDIPALPNAKDSPHPVAGEALLRDAGAPEGIASIVGAHHGRAAKLQQENFDVYQLVCLQENYWGTGENETWRHVQSEYLKWALAESGFDSVSALPVLTIPTQMLLTGLLVMADWIASGTRYFPLIDAGGPIPAYDPGRADAAWSCLGLQEGWMPEGGIPLDALCRERFSFEHPNALQEQVMRLAADAVRPGLLVIEAQMGSGKTEAALLAAELMSDGMSGPKRGGIFFGLPTQATANGIFDRVAEWGKKQAAHAPATIRLAHGAADLNESYTRLMRHNGSVASMDADGDGGMMVHEWFRGRKQALLSDFVVGTVDQLLMLALKQRHVMLRHLGLCGKVVIIDECHAYDAYMSQYLEAALQWLGAYHVPVILLSATLPCDRRSALIDAYLNRRRKEDGAPWRTCRDYPLLTWTDGGRVLQQTLRIDTPPLDVAIERLPDSEDGAMVERLHEALREGGCAGIIVNTVRRAQDLARLLRDRFPDFTVLLLHAQYILPDRAKRETELLKRVGKNSTKLQRNRLIVVGTQVCEQSLDLDFDLLVTELCPMDLFLQRLGRLHRHRRHDAERPDPLRKPRCLVLGAGETLSEGSAAVYGKYLLLRTRALLPERVVVPDDIPKLVQDTYDDNIPLPQIPEGYAKAREEYFTNQSNRRNNAGTFCLKLPDPSGFAALDTLDNLLETALSTEEQGQQAVRDGDPSVEVLVLRKSDDAFQMLAGGERFYADHVPDADACREIAAQKLRLPHALCVPSMADRVIDTLTARREALREWLQSPWLRGQLFLLLDENGATELFGKQLRYDKDYGLIVEEVSHASRIQSAG